MAEKPNAKLLIPVSSELRQSEALYWTSSAARKKSEDVYLYLLTHGYFDGPYATKYPVVAQKLGLFV